MTFASGCNAMQMWYTVMNHETGTSPSEPDIASIPGLRAQATASLSAVAPRLLWLAPNASMHEPSSSAAGEMKPPDLNLTETVLNSGIMRRRGLLARHRSATRSCCVRTGFRRILFSSIVQRSVEVPELHFFLLLIINGLAFIRHAQNF